MGVQEGDDGKYRIEQGKGRGAGKASNGGPGYTVVATTTTETLCTPPRSPHSPGAAAVTRVEDDDRGWRAGGWRRWIEAWTNRGSSIVGHEMRRQGGAQIGERVSISGWSRTRKGAATRWEPMGNTRDSRGGWQGQGVRKKQGKESCVP